MSTEPFPIRAMVMGSIFAALLVVCGWLSVPVGEIAFTMQTFGVFLTLGLLGGRWGTGAIGVYLLLGAVGLPVFSGFRGGLGVLLGPSGGYLLGFLAAGLCYWGMTAVLPDRPWARLTAMGLGQFVCYGFGTGWFWLLYGGEVRAVVLLCVVPYLLPDLLKLMLAHMVTARLRRVFK